MENSLQFLLNIALILLITKGLGLLSGKLKLPQVVGSLIAGILLGPVVFGFIGETSFIHKISELGVIILMFGAGLETDIDELKKSGKAAFLIALFGVLLPLICGFVVAIFLNPDPDASMLTNLFFGVILTATSVSITVETLKEMGKISSKAGNVILSAAIIDDVLGMIALTIVTSVAGEGVSIPLVLLKIVLFFVFSAFFGYLFIIMYRKMQNFYSRELHSFVIVAFAYCLLMSYCAEVLFGVADITGAYIAGLIISTCKLRNYISHRFNTISYMLFTPVFFASIGIRIENIALSPNLIVFSLAFIVVGVITKIGGCSFAAKLCKYDKKDSLRIGLGMVARGEVALIVTNKGVSSGIIGEQYFTPVVLLILFSSILTPIFLKQAFKDPEIPQGKIAVTPHKG